MNHRQRRVGRLGAGRIGAERRKGHAARLFLVE